MGWLEQPWKEQHNCFLPDDVYKGSSKSSRPRNQPRLSNIPAGWVWQCDECGSVWRTRNRFMWRLYRTQWRCVEDYRDDKERFGYWPARVRSTDG